MFEDECVKLVNSMSRTYVLLTIEEVSYVILRERFLIRTIKDFIFIIIIIIIKFF